MGSSFNSGASIRDSGSPLEQWEPPLLILPRRDPLGVVSGLFFTRRLEHGRGLAAHLLDDPGMLGLGEAEAEVQLPAIDALQAEALYRVGVRLADLLAAHRLVRIGDYGLRPIPEPPSPAQNDGAAAER